MSDVTPPEAVSAIRWWRRENNQNPEYRLDGPNGGWCYRFYGADDELLYVGATRNLFGRLRAHDRRFGSITDYVLVDAYPTLGAAEATEYLFITRYRPRFNVAEGTGRFPK